MIGLEKIGIMFVTVHSPAAVIDNNYYFLLTLFLRRALRYFALFSYPHQIFLIQSQLLCLWHHSTLPPQPFFFEWPLGLSHYFISPLIKLVMAEANPDMYWDESGNIIPEHLRQPKNQNNSRYTTQQNINYQLLVAWDSPYLVMIRRNKPRL